MRIIASVFKKLIIVLVILFVSIIYVSFVFGDEYLSWHAYEQICNLYDVEPNYDNYLEAVLHPQCFDTSNEEEAEAIALILKADHDDDN